MSEYYQILDPLRSWILNAPLMTCFIAKYLVNLLNFHTFPQLLFNHFYYFVMLILSDKATKCLRNLPQICPMQCQSNLWWRLFGLLRICTVYELPLTLHCREQVIYTFQANLSHLKRTVITQNVTELNIKDVSWRLIGIKWSLPLNIDSFLKYQKLKRHQSHVGTQRPNQFCHNSQFLTAQF